MRLAPGAPTRFELEDGAQPFASRVSVTTSLGAPTSSRFVGGTLIAKACELGCSIDYRFDLGAAARALDDPGTAAKRGDTFLAPPSTWLFHPEEPPVGTRFEIAVHSTVHVEFASGSKAKGGIYEGTWEDLAEPPYAAFGSMRRLTVPIGRRSIQVAIVGPHPDVGDEGLAHWVAEAGKNLAGFYGDYPRDPPLVIVMVDPGSRIERGSALGNGGASILVGVGQATEPDTFANDWILTHEMFHVAFPGLGRTHHWAEEGMATYLEPIARARRGVVPVNRVWREWIESMAQGLPAADDRGLDVTHTWGRTYWGGALFWFAADVEIRKKTGGRAGLPDVFRAIYEQGDISVRWPMSRVLSVADQATATDVVSALYTRHAHAGVAIDLDAIFADLGVSVVHGQVVIDDKAPLAALRRAIVVGP